MAPSAYAPVLSVQLYLHLQTSWRHVANKHYIPVDAVVLAGRAVAADGADVFRHAADAAHAGQLAEPRRRRADAAARRQDRRQWRRRRAHAARADRRALYGAVAGHACKKVST